MTIIDSFLRMAFARGARERDGLLEIGGSLAVFTPVSTFVELREELKARVGASAAREILFEVGRKRILGGILSLRRFPFMRTGKPRAFLGKPLAQFVLDLWRITGWGSYRVVHYDAKHALISGSTPTAKAYLAGHDRTKEPVCDLICGMLAGGMETYHGGRYNCLERSCAAKGDAECVFELFKRRPRGGTSPTPRGRNRSSTRKSHIT